MNNPNGCDSANAIKGFPFSIKLLSNANIQFAIVM